MRATMRCGEPGPVRLLNMEGKTGPPDLRARRSCFRSAATRRAGASDARRRSGRGAEFISSRLRVRRAARDARGRPRRSAGGLSATWRGGGVRTG